MELTKDMIKLVCNLEYIIGSQCYNGNSYDGWRDEYGCSFRYPVVYQNSGGEEEKDRYNLARLFKYDEEAFSPEDIRNLKYKFGSNHLYIGEGVIEMLEFLENRYELNFEKLEEQYQAKQN